MFNVAAQLHLSAGAFLHIINRTIARYLHIGTRVQCLNHSSIAQINLRLAGNLAVNFQRVNGNAVTYGNLRISFQFQRFNVNIDIQFYVLFFYNNVLQLRAAGTLFQYCVVPDEDFAPYLRFAVKFQSNRFTLACLGILIGNDIAVNFAVLENNGIFAAAINIYVAVNFQIHQPYCFILNFFFNRQIAGNAHILQLRPIRNADIPEFCAIAIKILGNRLIRTTGRRTAGAAALMPLAIVFPIKIRLACAVLSGKAVRLDFGTHARNINRHVVDIALSGNAHIVPNVHISDAGTSGKLDQCVIRIFRNIKCFNLRAAVQPYICICIQREVFYLRINRNSVDLAVCDRNILKSAALQRTVCPECRLCNTRAVISVEYRRRFIHHKLIHYTILRRNRAAAFYVQFAANGDIIQRNALAGHAGRYRQVAVYDSIPQCCVAQCHILHSIRCGLCRRNIGF